MEALVELERLQTQLLQRISKLELSYLPQHHSISSPTPTTSAPIDHSQADTVSRLSAILLSNGVDDFSFKRVPPDYYDWPLEARRDALDAASVHHLCKSIVLVNTQAQSNVIDCRDRNNSKYYVVVVQYTARFNAETVKNFLYSLNNGTIAKKKFNLRLAPEEISAELTGFVHNAVTCIGMKTDIPVILDEAIVKLTPGFFWLGGGEVDLKLGIRTSQLIKFIKPFIFSCGN
ncbi:YbaK/proline-tRNA ligase associated domain protein [Senna tora]|uniref:YbaK/proline-tRNA ligase associated domain protein n=1 Tax=Senna tora TaxID=362788 RepID=A0A834TTQ3_9FABA|nr:YbaK/proline-tRNA ligase associated domain protein [Senna tora]